MLPWMGHDVFAAVALVSKYLHNFIGPLFIFCSLLLFITFVRKNFFSRIDWQWLKHGGGMISKKHVPTGYFNAGEKLWFWGGLTLLGLLMSATGLVLDFVVFGQTRYILQIADLLHIVGATCYMAGALGHIYIGTIGMQGAYRAMRSGSVDEEWAREHHSLWLEDVQAGIKTPPGAVR
jgi:formate dehydrogenase subunit gamma